MLTQDSSTNSRSARETLDHAAMPDRLAAAEQVLDRLAAAEQQLRHFRSLIEHTSDIIAIADADATIHFISPSVQRILGYPPQELLGRRLTELVHGNDVRRLLEGLAEACRPAEVGRPLEFRVRHREGTWRYIEAVGNTLDGTPGISGLVLNARDVTQRRRAEQALRLAERQALQAEKLRALGQMASGVAHDLNQSLALVAGHADLALRAVEQTPLSRPDLRDGLHRIVQAAMDGAETVKRLLTFARNPAEDERERIDVGDLLREVAQLTAPRWRDAVEAEGRHISLHVEAHGTPTIAGSPAALREALTNLVLNAVDALPDGGTIRLLARQVAHGVQIEVADSGVGIPPAVQGRIFEAFFTTKGEHGTGLGLTVVAGIVDRHGGKTRFESEPGRGTRFSLTFPPAAAAVTAPADVPGRPGQPLRVLAVDDEPALGRMLALMLSQQGHSVQVAASGEQALQRLAAEPFDVVVSDLGMGAGMNGWELTREVRQRWPGVRVVLATGWGAQIDPAEAQRKGVAAVVPKPYRLADLQRALVG